VVNLAEALRGTGAARTFTDEPVDAAMVAAILDTARFAPSGGNRQPWRVCWVRDRELLAQVATLIRPVADEYAVRRATGIPPFSVHSVAPSGPIPASPNAMIDRLPDVPALLIVAADLGRIAMMDGNRERPAISGGASIYPFCWSILLAARLHGLGGVLTTFIARVPAADELLGLPADHAIAAMIALGHPEQQPTKLTRRPVESFATIDRFDGPALTP
jgi:nitroreductase